jgi:hypothetical protein
MLKMLIKLYGTTKILYIYSIYIFYQINALEFKNEM